MEGYIIVRVINWKDPIIWDYYDIEEEAIEEAKELNEYVNKGDAYYYVSKASKKLNWDKNRHRKH